MLRQYVRERAPAVSNLELGITFCCINYHCGLTRTQVRPFTRTKLHPIFDTCNLSMSTQPHPTSVYDTLVTPNPNKYASTTTPAPKGPNITNPNNRLVNQVLLRNSSSSYRVPLQVVGVSRSSLERG